MNYKKGDKVIYRNKIKTIAQVFIEKYSKKEVIILVGNIYVNQNDIINYCEITQSVGLK